MSLLRGGPEYCVFVNNLTIIWNVNYLYPALHDQEKDS